MLKVIPQKFECEEDSFRAGRSQSFFHQQTHEHHMGVVMPLYNTMKGICSLIPWALFWWWQKIASINVHCSHEFIETRGSLNLCYSDRSCIWSPCSIGLLYCDCLILRRWKRDLPRDGHALSMHVAYKAHHMNYSQASFRWSLSPIIGQQTVRRKRPLENKAWQLLLILSNISNFFNFIYLLDVIEIWHDIFSSLK